MYFFLESKETKSVLISGPRVNFCIYSFEVSSQNLVPVMLLTSSNDI